MLGRRQNPAEEEPQQPEGGSLWEDPEDQRVEVDMSQEARLRKVMRASNKTKVDGVEYQNLMKEHFQKRTKGLNYMAWADESQAMDTTITARSGISRIDTILNKDSGAAKENVAPEDMILIRKIAETNHSDRLDSVVQSLSAHPNKHDVVLATGFDKTLRLFKLGWDTSNEVALMECEHKAFIKDFPIKQAHFSDATTAVVCAVASPNLVFYDIEKQKPQTIAGLFAHKGQDRKDKFIQGVQMGSVGTLTCAYSSGSLGTIGFLDSRSKQRLFELNMNEGCQDVVFRSDDTELVSSGDKGHIYIWDLRKRSLLTKVKDLGSQSTSALACHNERVFTGSRAGIVNIYDLSTKEVVTNFNANPQPTKRFDNITTEISTMTVSPDGSKLLFASKWKKNSLRVADLGSRYSGVFKNWPNFKTYLGFVQCAAFSLDNNFLFLGNEKGKVIVYRLGMENDGADETEQADGGETAQKKLKMK